jgi:hypothetical protein
VIPRARREGLRMHGQISTYIDRSWVLTEDR